MTLNNNGCLRHHENICQLKYAIESTAHSIKAFNYFTHNFFYIKISAVSLWPENKSDRSDPMVFGQKFVLYDDQSSDGHQALMGRSMCCSQPWDGRWPVMGQQPWVATPLASPIGQKIHHHSRPPPLPAAPFELMQLLFPLLPWAPISSFPHTLQPFRTAQASLQSCLHNWSMPPTDAYTWVIIW